MTVQDRYEGLQTLFLAAHNDGCHFLTLCSIADEYRYDHSLPYLDLIAAIRICRFRNLINDDFYVNDDGTTILKLLTNKKWTRKDVVDLPAIGYNDYTEAVYYNPRTQFKHFRRRYFDTLVDSVTVKEGSIIQYRIYTVHD